MELFLQLGYGMKQHCKTLIKEWGAGSVILSPRDMSSETMCEFSKSLIKLGGASLLDPQFYNPHANHPGILQHANWDPESATEEVCSEDGAMNLVAKLKDENDAIGTSAFILPSLKTSLIIRQWSRTFRRDGMISRDMPLSVCQMTLLNRQNSWR